MGIGSVDQVLLKAKSFERRGEIEEARKLYCTTLELYPKNMRVKKALNKLFKKSQISKFSDSVPKNEIDCLIDWYNRGDLGLVIDKCKRLEFDFADDYKLWNILGATYKELGNLPKAEEKFRKACALSPNNPEVLNNLGYTLALQGRKSEAIKYYKEAIRIQPNYHDAYFNMGDALIEEEKFNDALLVYEKLLKFKRDNSKVYYNFGIVQNELSMPEKAIVSYKEAIRLNPHYTDAYNNMGTILRTLGKEEEASLAYETVLKIDPSHINGLFNLGNSRLDQDFIEEAIHLYKLAMESDSKRSDILLSLGNAFRTKGDYEEAVFYYDKAIEIDPEYSEALHNRGLMHLKSSEWVKGWRGFEHRWKTASYDTNPLRSARPLWGGSFVERLYVWAEAGVGDEVMFSSCFNELQSYCDRLIVSCDKRLLSLFERSFNSSIRFVDKDADIDEDLYDAQVPAGTAFGLLRQEDQSFLDNKKPYLTSDFQRSNTLRKKFNEMNPGAKIVGVSWKSSAFKDAAKRSLDLSELVKEISNDSLLVNLQYGDVQEELAQLQNSIGRSMLQLDDVDNFNDLDGFSALIQACDKVISIDNSTVHFAGALGVECHVLLPYSHVSDWRWGLHGTSKSYSYDKMYLHWQQKLNNWSGCLRSLKNFLIGIE